MPMQASISYLLRIPFSPLIIRVHLPVNILNFAPLHTPESSILTSCRAMACCADYGTTAPSSREYAALSSATDTGHDASKCDAEADD